MTARELPWGRRFLMCPPTHFTVLYEINPWMRSHVPVDPDRAMAQWESLRAALQEAGARIEVMEPVEGLPDIVFTANAGLVSGDRFMPTRFRHPERQGETPHYEAWFRAHGFRTEALPASVSHEGAGDALPFGDRLVSAYSFRTDLAAHPHVARLLDTELVSVELVDERYYHLDITFCPLDDRRAMVAAHAWSEASRRILDRLVPEALVVDEHEAATFVCNSVVVGRTIVMPACPPRIGRQLEAWGFDVAVVDVGEFLKAGGGCRCLTLALDVTLPRPSGALTASA